MANLSLLFYLFWCRILINDQMQEKNVLLSIARQKQATKVGVNLIHWKFDVEQNSFSLNIIENMTPSSISLTRLNRLLQHADFYIYLYA
jgi:hypothetical protein